MSARASQLLLTSAFFLIENSETRVVVSIETGIVHADPVKSVSQLEDIDFSLSFDERLMESLSYEYHSPTDLL